MQRAGRECHKFPIQCSFESVPRPHRILRPDQLILINLGRLKREQRNVHDESTASCSRLTDFFSLDLFINSHDAGTVVLQPAVCSVD